MTKEQRAKKLREDWSYEFKEWIIELGSLPVREVICLDRAEQYEMSRATIFELENGKYALVVEEGDDGYEMADAEITVYKTAAKAILAFNRWKNGK